MACFALDCPKIDWESGAFVIVCGFLLDFIANDLQAHTLLHSHVCLCMRVLDLFQLFRFDLACCT